MYNFNLDLEINVVLINRVKIVLYDKNKKLYDR